MGLWLKCPGCQVQIPLSLKVCPNCGQDLDKLTVKQRVYVIGAAEPAPVPAQPEPAPAAVVSEPAAPVAEPAAAAAEPAATPKPAKKPRKTKKKKA